MSNICPERTTEYWHTRAKCCTHTRKSQKKPELLLYNRGCFVAPHLCLYFSLAPIKFVYFLIHFHTLLVHFVFIHLRFSYNKVLERMNQFLQGFHDFPQLYVGVGSLLVGSGGSFSLAVLVLFVASCTTSALADSSHWVWRRWRGHQSDWFSVKEKTWRVRSCSFQSNNI